MSEEAITVRHHTIIGLPHLTLRLHGTPYAMGWEHGRRLGHDIVELERQFLQFLPELCGGGSRGRARALGIYWVIRLLAGATVIRSWPARYIEELRGMAAGMHKAGHRGFNLTRLAVINTLDDFGGAWGRRLVACSAFAVRGTGGGIIVGRNLDYLVMPQSLAALNTTVTYHPVGYNAFVSWAWPGYIGVATGVNVKGLSLSLLTSPTRDASPFGISEGIVNRLLLEETETLTAAVTRLGPLSRTVGTNLLLATAGHACVVESTRSHLARRNLERAPLVVTNHFHTAEMARWQREFGRLRSSVLEERYRSLEGSRQRASDLAVALGDGMTAHDAIHVLRRPELVSSGQVQSLVFDLESREFWVAAGRTVPVSAAGYQRLNWNELFN